MPSLFNKVHSGPSLSCPLRGILKRAILERPGVRKLEKARIFLDTVLATQPLRCIYSGEPILPNYDLDHFLPWSFVTHEIHAQADVARRLNFETDWIWA